MIVPITGKVTYPITLDPTVWIFDDRKIILEDAFLTQASSPDTTNELEKAAKRWDRELQQDVVKPPVNQSINKFEREKILTHSYVMPITDFLNHAEIKADAKNARLETLQGDVVLSISDLQKSYLLFAMNGKPLKEDGPVHLMYRDGSNKNNPITGVKKIVIQ
ncbi:hypothetical protein [Virgibacillus sp. LDC-1]|uniref:hypothetical protein n=1 Tax=Virgibacillus sp. LDC-1 TaxID=3039856 RepID=UPI0024DE3CBF|nr:hypothetical protein [Virgibacillus sp. LDC-1]